MSDQVFTLERLKPLGIEQYDSCRTAAIERVQKRIGDKPTRDQFKRELSSVWTALDGLALVVFVAALAISSTHIINHMGQLAASLTANKTIGFVIDAETIAKIHQVGMIALAEASMLLFMVMHAMSTKRRAERHWSLRYVSVPLMLALTAGLFIFVANWQSNIGLLESIMPPVFTIGIGLHLEKLIVAQLRRRDELDQRYLIALTVYEQASADPTKHPDYAGLLRQEVWQKLASLPANRDYRDAPAGFKHAAVWREMQRDTWAFESYEMLTSFAATSVKAPTLPFGSTAPDLAQGDLVSTSMTGRANGHGGSTIAQN